MNAKQTVQLVKGRPKACLLALVLLWGGMLLWSGYAMASPGEYLSICNATLSETCVPSGQNCTLELFVGGGTGGNYTWRSTFVAFTGAWNATFCFNTGLDGCQTSAECNCTETLTLPTDSLPDGVYNVRIVVSSCPDCNSTCDPGNPAELSSDYYLPPLNIGGCIKVNSITMLEPEGGRACCGQNATFEVETELSDGGAWNSTRIKVDWQGVGAGGWDINECVAHSGHVGNGTYTETFTFEIPCDVQVGGVDGILVNANAHLNSSTCNADPGFHDGKQQRFYLTVDPLPPIPCIEPCGATICVGESATLTPSCCPKVQGDLTNGDCANLEFVWHEGSCEGDPTGNGTIVVSPICTTTYFVQAVDTCTGCVSDCAEVTVTVNPLPPTPIVQADPEQICSGQNSTLSVENGCGFEINWYTGCCNGTWVGNGTELLVTPDATTTYYAIATNSTTGCVSNCSEALTVTVNPLPLCEISAPTTVVYGSTGNTASTTCGEADYDWYIYVDGTPRPDLITGGAGTCQITWTAPLEMPPWTELAIGVVVTSEYNCTCINDPFIGGEGQGVIVRGETGVPPQIPTISEWGYVAFILLLAVGGVAVLRRRRGEV